MLQNGKALEARILSPANAKFGFEEVNLAPPQRPAKGVGKLLIRLPKQSGDVRIAVILTPGKGRGDEPKLTPLVEWGRLDQ